jgi:hypothetical protein
MKQRSPSSSEHLRVRVYNVLFGDAILISVPDAGVLRHILIDVGNVQSGPAGRTDVFEPIIQDIQKELNRKPIDLYVMTHEHMDHVKGLPYAAEQLGVRLKANYAWLTASAAPDYYQRFAEAHKKKRLVQLSIDSARGWLAASPDPRLALLLLNNDYRQTDVCVNFLRKLAKKTCTTYVCRGVKLKGRHPFREVKFKIWAPEEDASQYYGAFHPAAFFLGKSSPLVPSPGVAPWPSPPAGVDASAFKHLLESRIRGHFDNLFTIDQAANNSSVVFSLEWRGWRLLFPGDAEIRSWRTMEKFKMLEPVHFLKIAHHGSENGTPVGDLIDKILPHKPPDSRPRRAAVSTCLDTYPGVPHAMTLRNLAKRCEVYSVLDLKENERYLDVVFDA